MDTGRTRATVPEEGLHHPGLAPAVDTERCEACGKLLLAPHFVLTSRRPNQRRLVGARLVRHGLLVC